MEVSARPSDLSPERARAVSLYVRGVAWSVLACLVAACSLPTCEAVPLIVAKKEERARLDMVSRGVGTSPTGRVEEIRVPEAVREYWVRAQDGPWYRVSEERYRAVEVGGSVEICR